LVSVLTIGYELDWFSKDRCKMATDNTSYQGDFISQWLSKSQVADSTRVVILLHTTPYAGLISRVRSEQQWKLWKTPSRLRVQST